MPPRNPNRPPTLAELEAEAAEDERTIFRWIVVLCAAAVLYIIFS